MAHTSAVCRTTLDSLARLILRLSKDVRVVIICHRAVAL